MSMLNAYLVPHPPLIVPAVGKGSEFGIYSTTESFNEIAQEISQLEPETIIVITPHSATYADYIHISPDESAKGNLGQFGAESEKFEIKYDCDLAQDIEKLANTASLPAGRLGQSNSNLDHGTMIPLYFINQHYKKDYKLVRISISHLSFEQHYNLGICIQKAVEMSGKNVVIIASGDLSHKLKSDGPYGYSEDGPKFDQKIIDTLSSGNLVELLSFAPELCDSAAECGMRPLLVLGGALKGIKITPQFYSYENSFGVGYAIFSFTPISNNPYILLARNALEHYVNFGEMLPCPTSMSEEFYKSRAGVFVSLKKHGALRGCIGTIFPTQDNIALEIISNAISAGTKDPRFEPITKDELTSLVYSVDILSAPEKVESISLLDVKRYGVIVSKGFKRGLLLPNLEGVSTVEDQINIALSKASIDKNEDYVLERFEVVRYK